MYTVVVQQPLRLLLLTIENIVAFTLTLYLDQRQLILESERRKQSISLTNRCIYFIQEVFLPRGFPNSVSKDYTEYQIWDTLQVT